jgi:hypothetical protein
VGAAGAQAIKKDSTTNTVINKLRFCRIISSS